MQLREFPLPQDAASPRGLTKPRTLTPKTPRRALSRALFDQLFRLSMTVVIKDYEIRIVRRSPRVGQRLNRTIKFDRIVKNVFLLPMPLRIAATQITNRQLMPATRFNPVEELHLVRRRNVSQYENFHAAFTRRS